MRPVTACRGCRINRRRCRVNGNNTSCLRCLASDLSCSLTPARVSRTNGASQSPRQILPLLEKPSYQRSKLSKSPPPSDLRDELVHFYFNVIHDKHHSLFHQPTFEDDVIHERVPDVLLYAMMALGARFKPSKCLIFMTDFWTRFSNNPYFTDTHRWDRGRKYADRAKKLLDLEDISITTIQACVLLGTLCFADCRTEAEALYYSVANRLALVLDLPNRPTRSELERQLNLRVWWTLYMIDIWSSTGVRLPRQLDQTRQISLPADETFFLSLRHDQSSVEHISTGVWAEMVHLAQIWAQIHQLNDMSVRRSLDQESLQQDVATLSERLDTWFYQLPTHMHPTRENLEAFASRGIGSTFAALHLGFYYYNQVLCYQFLAADCHGPSVSASHYAQRCKDHAAKFCDFLYLCNTTPGCECHYIMVGHMLVISSTVHMHTLLFSAHEEEITGARRRLERNFEILTQLQTYWQTLDLSLSRLKAFHNVCRTSMETSYKMDTWMLKFLLEHGARVNEKRADEPADLSPALIEVPVDAHKSLSPVTLQDWYMRTFRSPGLN